MPAPGSNVDIGTLGDVFFHPECVRKISGIMLYVGEEINRETSLPGEPPETTEDLARRKALIGHFVKQKDHWQGVIRTLFSVDPDIAAVKPLLAVPFQSLTESERASVNSALYRAMWRLVDQYKDKVSL